MAPAVVRSLICCASFRKKAIDVWKIKSAFVTFSNSFGPSTKPKSFKPTPRVVLVNFFSSRRGCRLKKTRPQHSWRFTCKYANFVGFWNVLFWWWNWPSSNYVLFFSKKRHVQAGNLYLFPILAFAPISTNISFKTFESLFFVSPWLVQQFQTIIKLCRLTLDCWVCSFFFLFFWTYCRI